MVELKKRQAGLGLMAYGLGDEVLDNARESRAELC